MSGIYYSDIDQVLRAAGCVVQETSQNAGWQQRARGSGGFPAAPLGIVWHHTASQTSIENDLQWQCHGCDDAPVGNMTIARDGAIYLVAAGASNCAGKGGPSSFSRGTVAQDSGNTGCWNIEVANNGVGEAWPQAQIDTYFLASNALNAHFGNQPYDVITHALGAGDGWTDRKIDPATAAAVQGPWVPNSANSSGTWNLGDIKNECMARAGQTPQPQPPQPQPPEPQPGFPPFPGTGDYGAPYNTVRQWQDAMILNGVIADNSANHDGVWGNGMHNACLEMQREDFNWSDADGIGGPHTWNHMRAWKEQPCPTCGKSNY